MLIIVQSIHISASQAEKIVKKLINKNVKMMMKMMLIQEEDYFIKTVLKII